MEGGGDKSENPAVKSPESASEKVPAPVIEVTCSPHAGLGLHETGRKLSSCVFCRTQWSMIIRKAKSVSFTGPLGGRLLFGELKWPEDCASLHPPCR